MKEQPTDEEIELCLKEAHELCPEATDDELWIIGAEIFEANHEPQPTMTNWKKQLFN